RTGHSTSWHSTEIDRYCPWPRSLFRVARLHFPRFLFWLEGEDHSLTLALLAQNAGQQKPHPAQLIHQPLDLCLESLIARSEIHNRRERFSIVLERSRDDVATFVCCIGYAAGLHGARTISLLRNPRKSSGKDFIGKTSSFARPGSRKKITGRGSDKRRAL